MSQIKCDTAQSAANESGAGAFRSTSAAPDRSGLRLKRDHDLRNFLYLASSFAQLMRDETVGPLTPTQKEFLEHIIDCASRAQRLLTGGFRSTTTAQPAAGQAAMPAAGDAHVFS
jgi:light-regulated signal transduction histidine kinase (bacteriophytochrome)